MNRQRSYSFRSCILFWVCSHRAVSASFLSHCAPSLLHSSRKQQPCTVVLCGRGRVTTTPSYRQHNHRQHQFSARAVASHLLAHEYHHEEDEEDFASDLSGVIAALEDTMNDETNNNNDYNNNNMITSSSTSSAFSPQKWKKKRYMMMKDVDDLIERGDPRAPHKAQELIHRMQRLYERTGIPNYQPTVQVYNLWINAIAKCTSSINSSSSGSSSIDNRGRDAEAVLEIMKRDGVAPSVVTFTSIMDAYARSNHPQAAQDAERVLFDYLQAHEQQSQSSKLSTITCDAVLNAWAQRGTPEAAARAQFLLERLEQFQNKDIRPTAHSYATVIHAWALCGKADKAQAILDRLLQPRPTSVETAAAATVVDTVVCNAVLHAWATSGDPQAGTRALHLFHRMQQLAKEKGYDTHPDVVTYNTLLSAWSHSGHLKAAPQAEKVLQEMIETHRKDPETSPRPNVVSYNSVLHAWSRSTLPGAAQRAQSVLQYMIRASEKGNTDIAPDVYSFTSVLNAWAKSKEPNKAIQARDLLDTMLQLYDNHDEDNGHLHHQKRSELQPTQAPFNAVLNACAFSALGTSQAEQREALQVAVSTFAKLRRYTGPDTVSFGNLLKCIANLMPVGAQARHDMALQTFRQCCDEGLVGELVWTEIQRAVPPRLLRQEVGTSTDIAIPGATVRALPRSWKRNVLRNQNKQTSLPLSSSSASQNEPKQEVARRQRKTTEAARVEAEAAAPVKRLRSITEPSYSSRDII